MNAIDILQPTDPAQDAERRLGMAVALLVEWGRQRRARLAAKEAAAGCDQDGDGQGVDNDQ